MNPPLAVEAVDLVKKFGDTVAVDGVSFVVPQGTVLGLLGPNGAGKTTTVRMLTTLSIPTSGTGRVAGHDILTEPDAVRRSHGADRSGGDGRRAAHGTGEPLADRPARRAAQRSINPVGDDLLERFSLTDAADRTVKTYSGGMRRRLDLAVSLIAAPPVLFLDEPTTGLDPRRARAVGRAAGLVAEGTTLLLTTQYLEEADQLGDDIVVIDKGRVIAAGTPTQLKDQAGRASVVLTVTHAADLDARRG